MARFINHSCDPNCETEKWTVGSELRLGIFATRTILKNEEVTIDYLFESFEKKEPCLCGASSCMDKMRKRAPVPVPVTAVKRRCRQQQASQLCFSGALERLMMLDSQRIEDKKLLTLPRVNTVADILDVLDHELLQLLQKNYRCVGDDGWESLCLLCGRGGQLLMCEHGKNACSKVAHANCMGIVALPAVFICPLHENSCWGSGVQKRPQTRALPDSPSLTQKQVSRV
jgi:hypothetical protein